MPAPSGSGRPLRTVWPRSGGPLRSPATTTEPARALGVTPSAVSQHLTVLRENGLVERERSGRQVLYLISALGTSLLGG